MPQKSLRLLIVSMLYEPDCVGIAPVATDLCRGLALRGHQVTVYTTYPYYPEWRRKSEVNAWKIQQEELGNVCVKRFGLYVPSKPSRLIPRLIHEMSFPLSLSRSLLRPSRFDGVMAFCPLLGSVAFAALRKTFYREPLWINIQDIPAEASLASGINKSRALHRVGSWAQKFLFRRGEVWSSISPEMVQRLESMQGRDTIVHHVPNWLTGSLAEQIGDMPPKGGTPCDTTKLLYSGTIGKKQGLLEFCQQLQRCQRPFQFEIRGEGSEAAPVRNWIDDVRDPRFRFGGLLPERQFVERMQGADWFVISETPNAGFSFLPSKLIPCISVGTPVLAIAGDSSPLAHEVSEHGLGHVIRWSELGQLQDRSDIWQAADDCELRRNCLQRASDFNRDVAIDRIEELLLEFAERRERHPSRALLRRKEMQV